MDKKKLYIFILILLIVISLSIFYYLGIFAGKDAKSSQEVEGVFGEVVSNNLDERVLIVESIKENNFEVILSEDVDFFDLYNRESDLSSIEEGQLVNVEGDVSNNSVTALKIEIADTNSNSEISAHDRDKSFTYSQGDNFKVILNDRVYPLSSLECNPSGIVENVSDSPGANPPYYASEFEAVEVGECTLKNGDFSVEINVEE